MNERIKELAEEATKKYDRLGNEIPFAQPDLERFAELIVAECLDIVRSRSQWETLNQIKERFGIEL
jgi:hypothetical protein